MSSFFEGLDVISSGTEDNPTIFSALFDFLSDSASWAGAVAALIGLLN